MSTEIQLFLEDMDEQLGLMESSLLDMLEMDISNIDDESINKVFRAMHTMKGNAGLFGYTKIIEFAHIAENLLDEIRKHKIPLSSELIDLFLEVLDHSKILISISIDDKDFTVSEEKKHQELMQNLSIYLSADEEVISEEFIEEDSLGTLNNKYVINVKLKNDFFKSGMDMLSIIKYLDAIGDVKKVEIFEAHIPLFDEISPLDSYLSLEIEYITEEAINEIEEAFEFVIEDISLNIEKVEASCGLDKVIEEDLVLEEKKEISSKEIEIVDNANTNKVEEKTPEINTNFTLKVESTKVDKLINQVSEMVIANAKITDYSERSKDEKLQEAVETMSEMLEEIRNGIMNIRMVQVGESFSKLRRVVSDIAKKTKKEVDFEIIGEDTELDKTVIERISGPLIHMLRNSIDHGIEIPSVRKKLSKSERGNITLKAYPDSGSIVIEIIDDGKGLDKESLFQKALDQKLVNINDKLSDSEIFSLIFTPGFSTASEITDISGRGVGMDVVKKEIENLRGSISISSELFRGTKISIRLPLTLAIIDGFLVQSGESKYIIPLDLVQECLELTKDKKEKVKENGYLTLRNNILPILDIAEYFDNVRVKNGRENIVVVKYGTSKVGLKVDTLHGEFQTVIKPLGVLFEKVDGFSGGTILGNGEIALILDIQKLIEHKIAYKENDYGN